MIKAEKSLRARFRSSYRVLAPFGRPYRRSLLEGVAAALLVVAARLAFPWPLRGVMELTIHQGGGRGTTSLALVPHSGDPVVWLVIAFVVIVLIWAGAEYAQRVAFAQFAKGTVRDARAAALSRLSRGQNTEREPADLMSRVVGDAARLKSGLRGVLVGVSRNGLFFLGVSAIVLVLDWRIGVVFVAGGLMAFAIGFVAATKVARVARSERKREGELIEDVRRALEEGIRPGRKEPGRTVSSQTAHIEGLATIAIHVVLAASTCGVLILAVHEADAGRASPGDVFTILVYVLFMHNKLVGLGRRLVRAGRVLTSAERLAKVVRRPRRPKPEPAPAPAPTGAPGG